MGSLNLHSCTLIFSFVCHRTHLTAKQLLKVQSTKLHMVILCCNFFIIVCVYIYIYIYMLVIQNQVLSTGRNRKHTSTIINSGILMLYLTQAEEMFIKKYANTIYDKNATYQIFNNVTLQNFLTH
jgi:hypothetical protein